MTPETHMLISALGMQLEKYVLRRLGESFALTEDVKVQLLNAGHVLGSSQFLITTDVNSLLYTGDINTYETLISEPAATMEADTLIIESTYGDASYVFPERESIYASIIKWVISCVKNGEIPAFKAYSVGKAQEILKLISTYTSLPVVVGWNVELASQVYQQAGVDLKFLPLDSTEGREVINSGGCVYLDSSRRRITLKKRLRWAIATGWALRYRFQSYDASFPLSSHADYKGLINFIQQINPKKVYVTHGFSITLAKNLRALGYDAQPITEAGKPQQLTFE